MEGPRGGVGMATCSFDWFGTGVRVESNSPSIVRNLGIALPSLPPGRKISLRLRGTLSPPAGRVRHMVLRSARVPLDSSAPAAHGCRILLEDLMSRSGGLFLLHGAALARDGRVLIVSAPSGFGKTTLAIHLLSRGFDLLTDDLVGIDRATGLVLPFPKTLGLRAGTRRTLPVDLLVRARAARVGRGRAPRGAWPVDAVAFAGRTAAPARPSVVVLMRPVGARSGLRNFPRIDLDFVPGALPPLDRLRDLPGVEEVRYHSSIPRRVVVHVSDAGSIDRFIRRRRRQIVQTRKRLEETPRFDRPPEIWPIGPFQAAIELMQEMANRGIGSRIEREFRGREGDLVAQLATLLGPGRCYAMTPGRLDRSLELIERCFDGSAP